jgi:uncharacterized protein with GYD domain
MQTYILLTKLGPQAATQLENRAKLSNDWYTTIKQNCPEVKFISHYALLGQYDFMDIYLAPNEESAVKVSMISRVKGAISAESLLAIPHDRYLELSEDISEKYGSYFKSFIKKKKSK